MTAFAKGLAVGVKGVDRRAGGSIQNGPRQPAKAFWGTGKPDYAEVSARQWQAARNGNKRRQWAAMIYPGEGKKGQPKAGDYVFAAEQTRGEAAATPHQGTAGSFWSAGRGAGTDRPK